MNKEEKLAMSKRYRELNLGLCWTPPVKSVEEKVCNIIEYSATVSRWVYCEFELKSMYLYSNPNYFVKCPEKLTFWDIYIQYFYACKYDNFQLFMARYFGKYGVKPIQLSLHHYMYILCLIGHFAQDCFQSGSAGENKLYDLLPDINYMMDQAKTQVEKETSEKKAQKKKKKKV